MHMNTSHRLALLVAGSLCVIHTASTPAYAQIASSCLRPLGIPGKWVENQTPPWDPTDSFDPTGPNPDVYDGSGFDALADQGRPMALSPYAGALTGQSFLTVQTGVSGADAFLSALLGCSGWLHPVGEALPLTP